MAWLKRECWFIVLLLIALLPSAFAYTAFEEALWCGNESATAAETSIDCTLAVNDSSYNITYLNVSITDFSFTFINDPINFSNKTFDCRGFTIDGTDNTTSYGILLTAQDNVTIKNCIITDFGAGIAINTGTTNTTIINNTFSSDALYGILVTNAANTNVTNNSFTAMPFYGLFVTGASSQRGYYARNTFDNISNTAILFASNGGNYSTVRDNIINHVVGTGINLLWVQGSPAGSLAAINNTITNTSTGILADTNNSVINNTISNSTYCIYSYWYNNVSGNAIRDCTYGIYTGITFGNNTYTDNNISNSSFGMYFDRANADVLSNNKFINNSQALYFYFTAEIHLLHNITTTNTIELNSVKYIYYYLNNYTGDGLYSNNVAVPTNAGFLAVVNTTNIQANGLTITNTTPSILLYQTQNITITNSTLSQSGYDNLVSREGVYMNDTNHSLISNVTLSNHARTGIVIQGGFNNTFDIITSNNNSVYGIYMINILNFSFYNTTANYNGQEGLYLSNADNTTFIDGLVKNNSHTTSNSGIRLVSGSDYNTFIGINVSNNTRSGFLLEGGIYTNITRSTIEHHSSGAGINISSGTTTNISITYNTITNSLYGVYILKGMNVTIADNSVTNNTGYGLYIAGTSIGRTGFTNRNITVLRNNITRNTNGLFANTTTNLQVINNTFINNTNVSISSGINNENNPVSGNLIQGSGHGIWLLNTSLNFLLYHNTFINSSIAHARDDGTNNNWNTTVSSVGQGNYWRDIFYNNLNITDNDSDEWANTGHQLPYNNTNGGNVTGNVQDFAPNLTNDKPTVHITSPSNGYDIRAGNSIQFSASGTDPEGANITYSWSSNNDGVLGTGNTITKSLNQGTHIITVTGADLQGLTGTNIITVIVSGGRKRSSGGSINITIPEKIIDTTTQENDNTQEETTEDETTEQTSTEQTTQTSTEQTDRENTQTANQETIQKSSRGTTVKSYLIPTIAIIALIIIGIFLTRRKTTV